MADYPKLTQAPIAEAVVEIRVRMSGLVVPERYAAFKERLKAKFPKAQNIQFVSARLHFDFEDEAQSKKDLEQTLVGVRLDSEDGQWVVQAKNDGLTISRLPPYESWDALLAMVEGMWPEYVEVFKPEAVVRLGVRYINRIELPNQDCVDLDSILTVGPRIPPTLPQGLQQFLTRVVLPVEDKGIVLVISQTLQPKSPGPQAPPGHVLLDIDASCEESLAVNSPEVWAKLEALRKVKNMAFFGSVTEPTWRRYL